MLSACSTIFEQDRLLELDATVKVIAEIAPQLTASGFSGIVVSISNPCDVIAQYFARITGLNVVGTGTALDSARLRRRLAALLGVSPHSVCAYELGEHGDSQIAVGSIQRKIPVLVKQGDQSFEQRHDLLAGHKHLLWHKGILCSAFWHCDGFETIGS